MYPGQIFFLLFNFHATFSLTYFDVGKVVLKTQIAPPP